MTEPKMTQSPQHPDVPFPADQRRGVQSGSATILLLLLAGCAGMAPRDVPPKAVEIPAAWSEAEASRAAATSLVQWWLRFDDPLLASLVNQALQANTSVISAQAALRQARALRDVAAAGLLPTVGASASAQRGKSGGNKTANNFKVGLDASWELDLFGVNRNALEASEATAAASAASLGDVQVSIAAEVALDYIALRDAQARLAIAIANLASQEETLQITQWRMQAGLVTSLETEQARAAVEQTGAQVPALRTSIEQSRHALAVLTGQPPAALASTLAGTGPVPKAPADLALAIPAETLRQRADVRAAEHKVAAALAQVDQADAARKPNFKLGGTLGLSALTLGSLTGGTSVVASLLAGVTLPIFDGGAGLAQVRAQQAALDQARMSYQGAVLIALREVEDALIALRGDRERYGSGLVDFQVVLETQRTQLSTQDGVASANADLGADHVRLYKALGGGWTPDGGETSSAVPDTNRIPRS